MKGIILAGGTGSRLYPTTLTVCKQLLPIYDKPMIYYPLSVLILAGITEILIIVRPEDLSLFRRVLSDGSQWGISISYIEQSTPKGLPHAYVLGEEFLEGGSSILILGDNFFYAQNLQDTIQHAIKIHDGGTIFSYPVGDPKRYGVLVLDQYGDPVDVVEKPQDYISNLAIPGLYIFDEQVIEITRQLKPSHRGETEITDIIRYYMDRKNLQVTPFGRGTAWFDSGTSESLLQASQFVHTIQSRQGLVIACLEEIAYRQGLIDKKMVIRQAKMYKNSDYGRYLEDIVKTLS